MTSASWNELRINKQVCDGVIKTADGMTFDIHRVIMSGFSPYFRAYFTNSLNNGHPEFTEMVVPDVSADMLSLIIEFAYTQRCTLTTSNVHSLMVVADRYSCEPVVHYCTEFIAKNINVSNCISNWRFGRTYFCKDLEMKARQFACDQMDEVTYSPEFMQLTAEELKELLSADELNVKQEESVFHALSRWVLHNPQKRQPHMSQLIHCVRFGLMSLEYYMDVVLPFQYHTKESKELLRTIDALFESDEESFYYRSCYFRPRIPNEVIFAFGGWSDGSPTDVIETYDKRSDCWYLTNMKDQKFRAYHGVTVLDNKIYVIGGFDGTAYFSTMHCFDPATNSWSERACMHDARCYVSICELGGEIYAIGGYNGRTRMSSAEKYNPVLNQWTMISSMNKLRSDASAASINNTVFVAGGFNGQEVMSSVEVYMPALDQWNFVDCMSSPRSGESLISHGRYIYAIGGFDGVIRLRSVERYNPVFNRWDLMSDMITARSNMGSVIIDNSILVIGGFNGATTIPYTELYDEENDVWLQSAGININRSALSACVCRGLPNAKIYTTLGLAVDPTIDQSPAVIK